MVSSGVMCDARSGGAILRNCNKLVADTGDPNRLDMGDLEPVDMLRSSSLLVGRWVRSWRSV